MSDQLMGLVAASQNFRFLVQHELLLAADAAAAEAYLHPDPDAALGKARRFGETLAMMVVRRARLGLQGGTQHARIQALAAAGAIPAHIADLFHEVRKAGNEAIHVASLGGRDPLPALRACFKLGAWWHREVTGTALGQQFVAPQPPPGEAERLRRLVNSLEGQLTRLEHAFAAGLDQPLITIGAPSEEALPWQGGSRVSCSGRAFILHDPVTELSASDGAWRLVEAGALGFDDDAEPVWVRALVTRVATEETARVACGLREQAQLLTRAGGRNGLPRLECHSDGDQIVVTVRPAGPTWREHFGDGQPLDRLLVPVALEMLAAVAETLGRLHRLGHAHRSLSTESVIVSSRRGMLRDAGLAALPRMVSEGGSAAAPEQRALARGRPGPHTDVFQLAALLYQACTGFGPSAGRVLPTGLSKGFDELLAAALDPDPSRRPAMSALASALRQERRLFFSGAVA